MIHEQERFMPTLRCALCTLTLVVGILLRQLYLPFALNLILLHAFRRPAFLPSLSYIRVLLRRRPDITNDLIFCTDITALFLAFWHINRIELKYTHTKAIGSGHLGGVATLLDDC